MVHIIEVIYGNNSVPGIPQAARSTRIIYGVVVIIGKSLSVRYILRITYTSVRRLFHSLINGRSRSALPRCK